MRARPREINIFNMSLLDILCGALGAFCFMMLGLLPFYVPIDIASLQRQKNIQELMKELDELRKKVGDPNVAEELRQKMEEMQSQVQQLEGERNRYANENRQLKDDNDALNKDIEDKKTRLKQRQPFVVMVGSDPQQELDVYLEDDLQSEETKTRAPRFDPKKNFHSARFSGDIGGLSIMNHGIAAWLSTYAVVGANLKIYVKFLDPAGARPATVSTEIFGFFAGKRPPTPTVVLNAQRFWSLVGTIHVDEENLLSFTPASAEQRNAEWRELMKSEPPPFPTPPPVSTPTAQPTVQATPQPSAQRTFDPAELERLQKQREERQRKQKDQSGASPMPSATPAPASEISEEERRARRERYLRERGLVLPSPTASPQQ